MEADIKEDRLWAAESGREGEEGVQWAAAAEADVEMGVMSAGGMEGEVEAEVEGLVVRGTGIETEVKEDRLLAAGSGMAREDEGMPAAFDVAVEIAGDIAIEVACNST